MRFEVFAPAAADEPGMHACEQVKVPDMRDAGRLRRRQTPASAVSISHRGKTIVVLGGDSLSMLTYRAETGRIAPTRKVEQKGVPRGVPHDEFANRRDKGPFRDAHGLALPISSPERLEEVK